MTDSNRKLRAGILDALYSEYGKYVSLAEQTSHDTRIAYRNNAKGVLRSIRVVEEFEFGGDA